MSFLLRKQAKPVISAKSIDRDAISVLKRLNNAGYIAYLVGGSVRDLLLDRTPKDFDIATSASPRQIRNLFRNAFLVGRRFRLALIRFGDKQIEAATFRRTPESDDSDDANKSEIGALYVEEDNYFGSPEEDAMRRDFTVNALFYDITSSTVIDYTGGLRDLSKKVLRSIGDPNIRFREDPVRMLRAVRLSVRLGFSIHSDSAKAITRNCGEIMQASKPRLFEEVGRLFTYNKSEDAFRLLWETKLMHELLPEVEDFVNNSGKKKSAVWNYLAALDAAPLPDGQDGRPVRRILEAPLRMAVLLAPLFKRRCMLEAERGNTDSVSIARDLIDTVLVHPYSTPSWRIPRIMCQDTANILASLDFHEQQNIHRNRFFRQPWFCTAMAFWRIYHAANGDRSADALLDAWENAYENHAASRAGIKHGEGAAPGSGDGADTEWAQTENTPDGSGHIRKKNKRRRHKRRKRSTEALESQATAPIMEGA